MNPQELNLADIKSSIAVDGYIPKPKHVRVKKHSEKYNKKAYEKAREKGNWHCEYCDIDVLLIRKKQHLKTLKHEMALENAEVKPEEVIFKQIVALMAQLHNEHNIHPEFVFNNHHSTHRIFIDDASVKRCQEEELREGGDCKNYCINETMPVKYITKEDCECDVCSEAPKPKKIKINKKPWPIQQPEPIQDPEPIQEPIVEEEEAPKPKKKLIRKPKGVE
jgi:hypothetical protein